MSTNIMTVNAQWSSRPDDERYLSLTDLHAAVSARRQGARQVDVAVDSLRVAACDDSPEMRLLDTDGKDFGVLSNWAFGQVCAKAKAPAGYLRGLPAALAQIPLQWSLESQSAEDAKVLTRYNGIVSASVTSPTYGRIWDDEVTGALIERLGPDWKVPAASYASHDPKRASTLYASDRDVFAFLVNEENPIEFSGESLFRGIIVSNSEVGSATFNLSTMLYRYVCDNRIIWGAQDFREIKVRHTSGGPHRFVTQAIPQLRSYVNSGTGGIVETIQAARAKEVGKDKKSVTDWLKSRGFTVPESRSAYESAEASNMNPRSVWGLVQGLTDAAHDIKHTDERVDLERRAGRLMDLVA